MFMDTLDAANKNIGRCIGSSVANCRNGKDNLSLCHNKDRGYNIAWMDGHAHKNIPQSVFARRRTADEILELQVTGKIFYG